MNIPDYIPVLGRGNHSDPKKGACVMEMVSFIAGEEFSDNPECVSRTIAAIARRVNDFVSDDNRNKIATMIPRFIGTDALIKTVENFQSWNDKVADALSEAFKNVSFIGSRVAGSQNPFNVLSQIHGHFKNERDENKRLTNEEYDDLAMKILDVVLDVADQFLERGEYAVTTEEAFTKLATMPGQLVQ